MERPASRQLLHACMHAAACGSAACLHALPTARLPSPNIVEARKAHQVAD